jgi:8-oxo-dGTP diphosphatase
MIRDPAARLLILKPTYKKGWTIPGGQIDPGESPWEACRRETHEESGLVVRHARLACVDFRPPKPERPGGVRFLFDCGTLPAEAFDAVTLQKTEIEDYRLAELDDALELLSGPLRRRISETVGRDGCVYLEDGRPVADVT